MSEPGKQGETVGSGAEQGGKDRVLDHDYDGIREYDNPMPGWWVYIFWATIVFAVLYWFNVPGIGPGRGRIAAYEAELARAEAKYGAQQTAAAAAPGDAELAALVADPAQLATGKTVYDNNCAACHGLDGGGVIGPNLTDDYWLHGGRPSQQWSTVQNGVLDKGMPAWSQVLKPEDQRAVIAYVISLHGTTPANPKAPQGVKEGAAGEPAPAQ